MSSMILHDSHDGSTSRLNDSDGALPTRVSAPSRFEITFADFRRLPPRKRRGLVHMLAFDDVTALTSAGLWFEIVDPERLKRMTLREMIERGRRLWKR